MEELQRVLKLNNGILDEESLNDLARVRGTLGINQFEAQRTLEAVTAPLMKVEVEKAVDDIVKAGSAVTEAVVERVDKKRVQLQVIDILEYFFDSNRTHVRLLLS